MPDIVDVQAILRRGLAKELAPAPTPPSRPPAAKRPRGDSRPSKAEDTFCISDRILNTNQLRAARALLGWDQATLARHAGVSVPTIKRIEGGAANPQDSTLSKVADALADAGIVPIEDGIGGVGCCCGGSDCAVRPQTVGCLYT